MAENVQYNLENSVEELEQMKRVGLFSEEEIRKVIKKRRILEYNIAKLSKRKEDYLRYVQYEIGLLNLIRIRRHKLRYFHKKGEIDNRIGNRINHLFKKAIKRFPEDIKLWTSHHDFLRKMHWVESITSMNAQMLKFHNKSPELWVTCAKWELEDNNSIDNARQLFQRALRFHPTSELIWKEYFRLELMYVDQLLKRRKVLGIEQQDSEADDNVLKGQVALVAYDNATKKIEGVDLLLSFLTICKEFDFTGEIAEKLYSDIEQLYSTNEKAQNALAQRLMTQTNEKQRTCFENTVRKYEDAVKTVPTEIMWNYYIQFLLEEIGKSSSEKKMKRQLDKVLNTLQQASELKLLSKEMYIEWIKLLYTKNDLDKMQKVTISASQLFPSDPTIWQYALIVHAPLDGDKVFLDTFNSAIENVPGKLSIPLWETAINWATCRNNQHIEEIFEKGLLQGPEVQVYIKNMYLKVTLLVLGIDATRSLYEDLKNKPPLTPEFFEIMITAEKSCLQVKFKKIRRCFEDALRYFGSTDPDIWLHYLEFVEDHPDGNPGKIGRIYSQAMKQLEPAKCEEFVNKHTLRFNKTYDKTGEVN